MSEVQTPVTLEREITIYATRGGEMKKITTAVSTWGELKPLVQRQGFDLNSLLAAENINRADLVNDLAKLPEGNFRLFLRPKQTKSGAELSYKELRANIQEAVNSNPDEAKAHFNQGKNYTTKGTEELRTLWNSYSGNTSSNGTLKASKPAVAEVVEVVKKVAEKKEPKAVVAKEPKATSPVGPTQVVSDMSEEEKFKLIKSIAETLPASEQKDFILETCTDFEEENKAPEVKEETEQEIVEREAREMMQGYR
jgi:hypothetical protein